MNYGIEQLKKLEAFSDIDRHVASYLASAGCSDSPLFFLIVMLLSRCIERGDVCLSLDRIAGRNLSWLSAEDPDSAKLYSEILVPGVEEIAACIKKSGAAGIPGERLPLLLDGNRLYFHRYMTYEDELASMVAAMCTDNADLPEDNKLNMLFSGYFPHFPGVPDMQAASAAVSLKKRLSVISGGPGTGKTSAVVKIIELITEARRLSGLETKIALTAPTGKAAAKLALSANTLHPSPGMARLESFTIHRLLGYSWNYGFRHNRENPVDFDVVVADECSMADLQLMHSFFSALKPGSRLILLGDRDQLASVEGGAVFGDICGSGSTAYSHGMAKWCSMLTGYQYESVKAKSAAIGDSLTFLTRNWRFGAESGIGKLASAVKSGSEDDVMRILSSGGFSDLEFLPSPDTAALSKIIEQAAQRYITANSSPYRSVSEFTGSFCILTATRKGNSGMEKMNRTAERVLAAMGVIDPSVPFYEGRPVMVTGNDYPLQLFNGDIGVVDRSESGDAAVFTSSDGTVRSIRCSRLPVHETAFAMTVHKSQGSEFDEVLVVLPDAWSPVMSRELLYTAVTRGRKKVTVAGNESVIRKMVNTRLERMSGLKQKLHDTTME